MGFLDKIKKSIELKQRMPNDESIKKVENKIIELKKTLEKNPNDSKIITKLYVCDVLKKLSQLLPSDFYSFQQLADIYLNEFGDIKQAKIYQNQANDIKNSF